MAETVKLGLGKEKALEKAVRVLKQGNIIVYPTETSYGIGADALNPGTVEKVHLAKRQPKEKPISVIIANEEQVEKIAVLDEKARKLIHNFMPAPLTLVCKKKPIVPDILSRKTIAFRISSNSFARNLALRFGSAITATSANLHGEPAIYSAREAEQKLGNAVDLIVDAGQLPKQKASTIFDLVNGTVLRDGPVHIEEIRSVLE